VVVSLRAQVPRCLCSWFEMDDDANWEERKVGSLRAWMQFEPGGHPQPIHPVQVHALTEWPECVVVVVVVVSECLHAAVPAAASASKMHRAFAVLVRPA